MIITVYSAQKLTPVDMQKIRYIMKKAQHIDTCLYNTFPDCFNHREGNNLFFDKGNRRYCEKIDTQKAVETDADSADKRR